MKAISLFSGIGGMDIGFSSAGFNIIAQVEIDPFCQRVLRRHAPEWWPNAAIFADVRQFGRSSITGNIDAIFGGFPCQPHSIAGKRLGAEDDRDMWPQFRRIIGEFRPRTVLLENVPGIITGYAVHIISDFAALGYDCRWGTIRASDTGTPHKRERWFCMAYDNGQRQLQQKRDVTRFRRRTTHKRQSLANTSRKRRQKPAARKSTPDKKRNNKACQRTGSAELYEIISGDKIMGNTEGARLPRRQRRPTKSNSKNKETKTGIVADRLNRSNSRHRNWAITQSRMGRATNGIPAWLDEPRWPAGQGSYQHEWEAPRTIGKGIDTNRAARIKALGNAVVPQVAYPLACQIRNLL